jgi:hypothetical protein
MTCYSYVQWTVKKPLPRKPLGIGHIYTYTLLLSVMDTVTYQIIDLFSWDSSTCLHGWNLEISRRKSLSGGFEGDTCLFSGLTFSDHFVISMAFLTPPLWFSGQSCWLQIQRSEFDSRHYKILWEVVGLERGLLRLVSTIEELLGRKNSGSGLENREYWSRDPSRWSELSAETLHNDLHIYPWER